MTCVKCEEPIEVGVYLGADEFAHHGCVGFELVRCAKCGREATLFPSGRVQCAGPTCGTMAGT